MIAEMTRLEDLILEKQSTGRVDDLRIFVSMESIPGLVELIYLLGSVVPTHSDVVCAVPLGRHERLKDLSNDRAGCIVRVDQMDVIAYKVNERPTMMLMLFSSGHTCLVGHAFVPCFIGEYTIFRSDTERGDAESNFRLCHASFQVLCDFVQGPSCPRSSG